MNNPLHIVCPHCDTVNRVQAERLRDSPVCGRCRSALFTGVPVELTAAQFPRYLQKSDVPLLVDFWAPWCGPCKAMAPQFAQAAAQLEPRLHLAKVNTEEAPAVAAGYGIRSIPTLILFHKGRELARQSGAMNAAALVQWADRQLAGVVE